MRRDRVPCPKRVVSDLPDFSVLFAGFVKEARDGTKVGKNLSALVDAINQKPLFFFLPQVFIDERETKYIDHGRVPIFVVGNEPSEVRLPVHSIRKNSAAERYGDGVLQRVYPYFNAQLDFKDFGLKASIWKVLLESQSHLLQNFLSRDVITHSHLLVLGLLLICGLTQ